MCRWVASNPSTFTFSLAQSNGQHAIHWWRRLVSLHKNANQIAEFAAHLHIQTTQVFDWAIQSKWKDFRRWIRAGSRRFQGQTSAVQRNLFKNLFLRLLGTRDARTMNFWPGGLLINNLSVASSYGWPWSMESGTFIYSFNQKKIFMIENKFFNHKIFHH